MAISDDLTNAVLLIIAISAAIAVGTFLRFYLVSWLGERVSADLRKAVFANIVRLHPGFFETNRSGEIMSRLTTDTTLLQTIIGSSFSMALRSSLTLTGALVMMFITNLKLSLIIAASVPLVLLPILIFGRRVRKLSNQSQDSIASVGSYAGEIIQHIKVVQSYTREAVRGGGLRRGGRARLRHRPTTDTAAGAADLRRYSALVHRHVRHALERRAGCHQRAHDRR